MPSISNKALAAHWCVNPSYIRQLRTRKSGPVLPTFDDRGEQHPERWGEADEWRRLHAPPRKHPQKLSAPSESAGGGESADTTEKNTTGWKVEVEWPAETQELIDRYAQVKPENFDAWVVEEAEKVVKEQLGLYRAACATRNLPRIAAAFDNWQNAARRCADLRARFLHIQERSANIISLDRAADIVGREMGRLQELLDTFAERWAAAANPAEPAVARAAMEKAIDEVHGQMASVEAAVEAAGAEKRVA